MGRANIIPACVAYLGCVGMSWGVCHETSRPRQDNKFEKWCKESVCLSSTFWESNFSQKRTGWIFQTSRRIFGILYLYNNLHLLRYAKRHVPVFSHKTPASGRPVPGGYQTASQRTPRTNGFSPSSNQPVVAACVEFGNVSKMILRWAARVLFLSKSPKKR